MNPQHRQSAPSTASDQAARVAVLTDKLHESVTEFTSSAAWTRMLGTLAKFHQYSTRNILLLLIQAEERGTEITRVAGYRTWQTLGRQVRKGETSYDVLAPVRRRLSVEEAAERAATGEPAYDAEGRPIMIVYGFRIEHVFDISQTDGAELATVPAIPFLAGDDATNLREAVAALITKAGFTITRQALAGGIRGETNYTRRTVTVAADLCPAEAAHILTHELGHIRADHEHRNEISRAQRETEADSIAYVVCSALGFDVQEKAMFYIAQWSKGDPEVLEASVAVIQNAAGSILTQLETLSADDGDEEKGRLVAGAA